MERFGAQPLAVISIGAMSEKRHRQGQRRARRKAVGRPRSNGSARDTRLPGRHDADRALAELLAGMAEIAARGALEPSDALDAELWASCLIGTWHAQPMPGADVDELFIPGFVDALEQLGTAAALATLRAMSAVGAEIHRKRARAAADRLAARGLAEPSWSGGVGQARPTAAALMHDQDFDDGVSVLVEFDDPGAQPHTLGIYIDHNMGGLVKDVFLAGPLSEVRGQLDQREAKEARGAIRELDLGEARTRVEAAVYTLDHTYDPPVNEDVGPLRALIEARMCLLPEGFELPDEFVEFTPEQRSELLSDFLGSPDGQRWRGDEDAEDVVGTAIGFGADYNHGGPLRWSPVVVEIYMTSWLARKVVREPEFFKRVPDVLRDWVAYAGRRRGVPSAPLREAVAAVKHYRKQMLEATSNPEAWGLAKTFAVTAQQAGVDLSDRDALDAFIEQYNAGLGT